MEHFVPCDYDGWNYPQLMIDLSIKNLFSLASDCKQCNKKVFIPYTVSVWAWEMPLSHWSLSWKEINFSEQGV